MKKVVIYCIALLLTMIVSCQKETLDQEETNIAKETENFQKGGNAAGEIGNELVILYPDGTTEAEKILKRAEYNVLDYKTCKCADPNLELWIFEEDKNPSGGGGLEEKKGVIKGDEEIEGTEYNPNIKIYEDVFVDFGGVGITDDGLLKRVSANQGVTVAVLDTGIMYDYPGFTGSFLYNSSQNACTDNGYNELFGWNFVDQDNNPYDNHSGRHGTIVTNFIASQLKAANVNYQILPVKVADRAGNIEYFDALCGFQYAASKPDVNVINMSFGWNHENRELLGRFIENANDVLVVTSAGNKGLDNDVIPHYPSSYESNNILAVAAMAGVNGNSNAHIEGVYTNPQGTSSNSSLASFSNRGIYSVDIAASGEYIPFVYNNETLYVSGTSYSAALTSGYSGALYQSGMSGILLKNTVIENAIYDPNLSEIQYSKHIPD
ncbi:cell wall-associated protease [Kordia sp. SMS9]|uniref:S8 family serine peptidase n=1 Tax=Kordia sp. SMS9 TaxID=2282170 RepID=UPI000E0D6A29|nr:S8 family serine peptidase [Kordia sp. SMS9]AXG68588.1 cell wall-associated protease [Kordia sp. SMS9]